MYFVFCVQGEGVCYGAGQLIAFCCMKLGPPYVEFSAWSLCVVNDSTLTVRYWSMYAMHVQCCVVDPRCMTWLVSKCIFQRQAWTYRMWFTRAPAIGIAESLRFFGSFGGSTSSHCCALWQLPWRFWLLAFDLWPQPRSNPRQSDMQTDMGFRNSPKRNGHFQQIWEPWAVSVRLTSWIPESTALTNNKDLARCIQLHGGEAHHSDLHHWGWLEPLGCKELK